VKESSEQSPGAIFAPAKGSTKNKWPVPSEDVEENPEDEAEDRESSKVNWVIDVADNVDVGECVGG